MLRVGVICVLLHISDLEAGLVATRGSPRVQRSRKTGDGAGVFPFRRLERRGLPWEIITLSSIIPLSSLSFASRLSSRLSSLVSSLISRLSLSHQSSTHPLEHTI